MDKNMCDGLKYYSHMFLSMKYNLNMNDLYAEVCLVPSRKVAVVFFRRHLMCHRDVSRCWNMSRHILGRRCSSCACSRSCSRPNVCGHITTAVLSFLYTQYLHERFARDSKHEQAHTRQEELE